MEIASKSTYTLTVYNITIEHKDNIMKLERKEFGSTCKYYCHIRPMAIKDIISMLKYAHKQDKRWPKEFALYGVEAL